MLELLSNNALFVSQLSEDKSLALLARDLIFFTTDLQAVNFYSTIQALELIYFLTEFMIIRTAGFSHPISRWLSFVPIGNKKLVAILPGIPPIVIAIIKTYPKAWFISKQSIHQVDNSG